MFKINKGPAIIARALFIFICLIPCSGCGKSSPESVTPKPDINKTTEQPSVKTEIIGKDEDGKDIIKSIYETEDSIITITEILHGSVTGKIIVTGTANFNEVNLMTPEREYYTLDPEIAKNYWQEQENTITVRGRIEKRIVQNFKTRRTVRKNWIFPE